MATPRFSKVPRPHRKSLGTKLGCGIVAYPGVNERAGYEVVELVESGIIIYYPCWWSRDRHPEKQNQCCVVERPYSLRRIERE